MNPEQITALRSEYTATTGKPALVRGRQTMLYQNWLLNRPGNFIHFEKVE